MDVPCSSHTRNSPLPWALSASRLSCWRPNFSTCASIRRAAYWMSCGPRSRLSVSVLSSDLFFGAPEILDLLEGVMPNSIRYSRICFRHLLAMAMVRILNLVPFLGLNKLAFLVQPVFCLRPPRPDLAIGRERSAIYLRNHPEHAQFHRDTLPFEDCLLCQELWAVRDRALRLRLILVQRPFPRIPRQDLHFCGLRFSASHAPPPI